MTRWAPIAVTVEQAANETLPGSRARGEVGIVVVGDYRKVVLANPGRTRRRGTFFSVTS